MSSSATILTMTEDETAVASALTTTTTSTITTTSTKASKKKTTTKVGKKNSTQKDAAVDDESTATTITTTTTTPPPAVATTTKTTKKSQSINEESTVIKTMSISSTAAAATAAAPAAAAADIKITTKTEIDDTEIEQNNENVKTDECHVLEKGEKQKSSSKKKTDGSGGGGGGGSDKSSKKKSKKIRKSDAEKENISVKSSFSKFDALQKKNILHVRSSGAGKAQDKFNGDGTIEMEKNCKSCGKQVYKMEEIKAEKSLWHKQCFKCSECLKQLNVDNYESHETILYCKPHFKCLFTPKAVDGTANDIPKPQKPELIIRENEPIELPPDVVRSSDKTDLGLKELQQLNVRSRYQMFEHPEQQQQPTETTNIVGMVKRSPSILSKLAKFQAKGLNVDALNELSSENDDNDDDIDNENDDHHDDDVDDDDDDNEDIDLIRAKRVQREKPLSFANMNDIKSRFESGHAITKEERREERKQEIQNIRSRLFLGKQAKIKEMYQQAVLDSEQGIRASDRKVDITLDIGDKAKQIKDRFEKGEIQNEMPTDGADDKMLDDDERAVFEQGIGKKSRTIFLEMDANATTATAAIATATANKSTTQKPEYKRIHHVQPCIEDVVRSGEQIDEIKIETADISNKFKFFETYKPAEQVKKSFRITPPRDGVVKMPSPDRHNANGHHAEHNSNGTNGDGDAVDPNADPDANADADADDDNSMLDSTKIAQRSHTTTKMLTMFREMEEKKDETTKQGLKPLKRFTPPPDDKRRLESDDSERDYTDSSDDDDDDDEEDDDDEDDDNEDDEEGDDNENKHKNQTNYIRSSDRNIDEYLMQSKSAARAKQLRAKFERWESKELQREQNNSSIMLYDGNDVSQVESTKDIRAKFESMRDKQNNIERRDRIKVNRFV